jgi:outer membrane biosynthesis protein TonB
MTVFLIVVLGLSVLVFLLLLAEYVDAKKIEENDRADIELLLQQMEDAEHQAEDVQDQEVSTVEIPEQPAPAPAPVKKVAKKAAKKTAKVEPVAAPAKRTYKKKSPKA